MKRRSFWLGAVLAANLLCLAVVLVLSPWDTPSLAEQIAADQDLPAGSVTLLSEGTLTQGQEQAEGTWQEIPMPPPPTMVCFALGERSTAEYQLCDAAGAEL